VNHRLSIATSRHSHHDVINPDKGKKLSRSGVEGHEGKNRMDFLRGVFFT
jgi:hypothetical protein